MELGFEYKKLILLYYFVFLLRVVIVAILFLLYFFGCLYMSEICNEQGRSKGRCAVSMYLLMCEQKKQQQSLCIYC